MKDDPPGARFSREKNRSWMDMQNLKEHVLGHPAAELDNTDVPYYLGQIYTFHRQPTSLHSASNH